MEAHTDAASRAEQALVDAEVRATARDPRWPSDTHMVIDLGQQRVATAAQFLQRLRTHLDSVAHTLIL